MKKLASLLCAMVLTTGAFAQPVNPKAAPVEPVQKAAQSDYQFTTPTDFVALQYGGGTGDYVIFLYANNQPVAQLSIKTASDNSLAGTYTLGVEGGQSYNSALYQGNNTLTVKSGKLSLAYCGIYCTTTENVYDVVGEDLEVEDGTETVTCSFSGQVRGLAAWKDYYIDCNKNGQNCDKARITLTDEITGSPVPESELPSGSCGAKGDNLTWDISCDGELTILTIKGIGAMADYSQSSTSPWHNYSYYFHSVLIEQGVANIGNRAFYMCNDVTSVSISNTVTNIGESAFEGCTGLTSIDIPNSVTSIGNKAFCNCSSMTSATFGNKLKSIGASAFEGCLGLTSIVIPGSVTSIGASAFAHCYYLESVTFESAVPPTIGYNAFLYCTCDFIVPCGCKDAYMAALGVDAERVKENCDIETGVEATFTDKDDSHIGKPARKFMENGILFIERNGKVYTPQGVEL
ncbi:MAG: leucine-rich repeat domain-containing protein [Paludibacteraceae bacterium]|nr:leucine-rich repeat domain-containing protein [Paludibacteraceae bacterium]